MASSAIRIAPTSSTSRGDVVLQPNYFTSSVYVKALRDDISTLVLRYHEAYSQPGMTKPFLLFKTVWKNMGWTWLQFKVFDHRSRQTFLEVTVRLFLERTVKTEAPFTRVVALFGMYLFFYTQIKEGAPPLLHITNIPIPFDQYVTLMDMSSSLASPSVAPLQHYVRYVLSCFRHDCAFLILPKTDLGAMNPRELPRELHSDDGIIFTETDAQKRKGRPARREKGKKARLALEGLDNWVSKSKSSGDDGPSMTMIGDEYRALKSSMLHAVETDGALPEGSVHGVNREVLKRMREAQELVESGGDNVGIRRLEQVVEEMSNSGGIGLFGLYK